jgi:hypothetical protein
VNIIQWLLLPVTAHAILNPVPTSTPKIALLGENTPYVVDYPIVQQNSLYVTVEPQTVPTDEVITLLQQYFPDNWQTMYEIAKKESDLDPMAYNPESHKSCAGSFGILQVGCSNYSGNPKDLFDPETNIRIARQVYDKQNYGAWGVCTKKIVQCDILNTL